MDNFKIDIVAEGRSSLERALEIAMAHNGRSMAAFIEDKDKGLILFWVPANGSSKLPFSLDPKGAADFASRWLDAQDYPREPDHDGDNGKGWRVYCEGWGHVGIYREAICAIQPKWAMYGK